MGLLDALFDQNSFGGQGGGLLDLIKNTQAQNTQYQPSPGFANNQAAPIGVGGYQMPRIGEASQFTPDPAAIPQNAQPAQGQLPMQASQPLPPALGGAQPSAGFGDRLNAGAMNFANAGGLLPALVGGVSGLLTGQRTDHQGMAQQNLKAQYDALVPTLGPQKAMLAVMNPEAGKILLEQALQKHQYAFTKLDDGTIVRQDPRTGAVEPAYQATPKAEFGVINEADGQKTYGWIDKNKRTTAPVPGTEPRATSITGPDGKQIQIPEGVDRKSFVNEVSRAGAKAAAGEKTEVQAKSEKFGNKMENAEKNLSGLDDKFTDTVSGNALRATESIPGVGRALQSEQYQKYVQARDNFITALLRDESGAAIGTAEFKRYERELFPQPGEGPALVAQKKEARRIAIEAMKKSAGPGYKSPVAAQEGAATTAPADPLGIR